MAANVLIILGAWMEANGGAVEITKYIGDGTNAYVKNQLCYIVAGVVTPASASGAVPDAKVLDTDETIFASAHKLVLVNKDTAITSDFVEVIEISEDTILEGYVVDSSATGDVTMAQTDIGTLVSLYQEGNGRIGVDNTTDGSKGVVYIQDVDHQYDPWRDTTLEKDSGGTRHDRVRFKFKPSLVL